MPLTLGLLHSNFWGNQQISSNVLQEVIKTTARREKEGNFIEWAESGEKYLEHIGYESSQLCHQFIDDVEMKHSSGFPRDGQ